MIELHQFPYVWNLNPSPFCLKVETYCQLAGIRYRVKETLPIKAPRGKLPFIVDGETRIPDSGLIVEYLKASSGDRLDGHLTPQQHARGHLLRRLCEESLYFALVYSRWLDDQYWPDMRAAFFQGLPPGMRQILPVVARRSVRRALVGQGIARHPREEVYEAGEADLVALATSLEETGLAVDQRPTSYDATVYSFLVQVLRCPLESPLKAAAGRHPVLGDYLARMETELAEARKQRH
ncbi:glutathione S-transferase family protein [Marinobacteraceae bacterium S3BR75-40.1]